MTFNMSAFSVELRCAAIRYSFQNDLSHYFYIRHTITRLDKICFDWIPYIFGRVMSLFRRFRHQKPCYLIILERLERDHRIWQTSQGQGFTDMFNIEENYQDI